MRTIKFRGEVVGSGETIYGDLVHVNSSICIRGYLEEGDKDSFGTWEVDPRTVSQLIGVDKNGVEVYEGDKVIEEYVDGYTKEKIARLEGMTQDPETAHFFFFPFPAPFTTLKQ